MAKKKTAPTKSKKPYTTPRLASYGDLKKIVMAKASNRADGAGPATKK